ncbi:5-(carboxyamino)imidazole ribonucleotide synthase [Oceanomicrobium pacificus]|uniref:N5-carboxyaminoimidazole ribonucleotide synthase n=1 Tax=Oceanomicrobium pacificus TaxID=2692916 RepID=A0A6B0TIN5_9RHOB|nr:5-(carboxyamino)imidazole ribonucleotide synthase [Oceanomicrobium pacificus]MXU64227.1 5-(carboxyamino)imidazole ribonucleotide synthase [Oceanomicrobium pacificus]
MSEILPAGSTIGILGGGQLGRMLAMAAARLDYRCHIYDPADAPPAGQVVPDVTCGAWTDIAALERFARAVDLVTFEFENVPAEALDAIEAIVPVRPGRRALSVSQDRIDEKDFLTGIGLTTAPYARIDDLPMLEAALGVIGTPSILKTRRMGYDGKGQMRIDRPDQAKRALELLDHQPAVLEGFVDFEREISVIGARGADGQTVCFDPGENMHRDGILRRTLVPAEIPEALKLDAVLLTGRILNALDYVGVMGVELFVTDRGLVVNEIAPRVHNSGHWTQNGCAIDQFEQHIRAITGMPLGDGSRFANVEMINLIGEDLNGLEQYLQDAIHLYGKADIRDGRKMGHVNRVRPLG